MPAQPTKICTLCGEDCSAKPRVKDASGSYACRSCHELALAAGQPGQDSAKTAPPPAPAPAPTARDRAVSAPAKAASAKPAPAPAPAAPITSVQGAGFDELDAIPPEGFFDEPSPASAPTPARACPGCGAMAADGARICVGCGHDFTTNAKLRTRLARDKTPRAAVRRSAANINYEPASGVPRLLAAIIDNFILGVIIGVVFAVLFATGAVPTSRNGELDTDGLIIVYGVYFVLAWLYFALPEGTGNHATLGKRVMGVSVAHVNGGECGLIQSSIRLAAKFLLSIFIVPALVALFNRRRQTLWDMVAGTVVV